MRLKRLKMKQFCQHADRTVDFPVGVIGVRGANGSGKSNLIKGIRFGVLGESGNDGTKADDMNWTASADTKDGSVELQFEAGGSDGEVSRSITKARANLKHGTRTEKSVNGVNSAMLDIAGLPKKTIQDVIFVMQGELESILFEEPAERKKRFQSLFGIDKAEPLRVILQRELAEIGEPPSDERLKELQTALDTSIDPQLRQLHELQSTLKHQLAGVDKDALQAILNAHLTRTTLLTRLANLEARAEEVRKQVAGVMRIEIQSEIETTDRAAALEAVKRQTQELCAESAMLQSRGSIAEAIKRWEAQKIRLTETLTVPEPQPPETSMSVEEAQAVRDEAYRELMPKETFVRAFKDATGPAPCPTCGEIVQDAAARVAQFSAEIATVKETIASVDAIITQTRDAYQKYMNDRSQWITMQENAKKQLADIQEQLSTVGNLDTITADANRSAEINRMIRELADQEEKLTKALDDEKQRELRLATLSGTLDELKTNISIATADVANTPIITDEDAQLARQQLSDAGQREVQLAGVEGQITQLQANRATIIADMEKLQEQIAQSDGLRQYREYCERARTLLHHDCLPMMVTQAYLSSLNAKMNEYLRTFNVPFTCAIKDDLSVICQLGDTTERSAARLSGGEKVVLSISFRFAIHSLFASSFGFMVLDEPTAYLDDGKIAAVVELLQQVRQYAHSTGMQIIVPTHELALMSACDAVIELS